MSIAPSERPTGTVTFLLTDIEGSTQLVRSLGDRWSTVVGDHKRLLREAVIGAGGHEVDSRGEEAFFVFRRAQDALTAATAAQRALSEHPWPDGGAVRVRMGLHTGEPALGDDGGYLGIDVHRAARICAAGHGGQVLVSETTRALAAEPEARFLDLGPHQLRGFARPERIYQLAARGLADSFPALRTVAAGPFEGKEPSLAKAAQTVVTRGRPRIPSALRQHRSSARRLADVSWHMRSVHRGLEADERPEGLELARALLVLSRTMNDADRCLTGIDRRALERQLSVTRELARGSRYAQKQADVLARQAASVHELTAARAAVDERIDELERGAETFDAAEGASLRLELDSLNLKLEEALTLVTTEVGNAAERLHRTRHRGIYRQGDLWAIPYVDSLGVDRVRRFDDLGEARAFRRRVKLARDADKLAHKGTELVELGGGMAAGDDG